MLKKLSKIVKISPDEITEERFILADTPELWEKATHYTFIDDENCPNKSKVYYFVERDSIYRRLGGGEGYVYVMECNNQPGICKIGETERTPQERLREINNAQGVIVPWYLTAAFPCRAPRAVEQQVHFELGKYRVNSHKEGFNVTPKMAIDTITKVIAAYNAYIVGENKKECQGKRWFV